MNTLGSLLFKSDWGNLLYRVWAPMYDKFFNSGKFLKARKEIFQKETLVDNQKILFVGVGTGADLELINYKNLNITAIDYSTEMLENKSWVIIATSPV